MAKSNNRCPNEFHELVHAVHKRFGDRGPFIRTANFKVNESDTRGWYVRVANLAARKSKQCGVELWFDKWPTLGKDPRRLWYGLADYSSPNQIAGLLANSRVTPVRTIHCWNLSPGGWLNVRTSEYRRPIYECYPEASAFYFGQYELNDAQS